jgi:hypothetical protein
MCLSLSYSANGTFGLRERKPRTKVENCILEPDEIKTAFDLARGEGVVLGRIPFEKCLPDGRSKVSGKKGSSIYRVYTKECCGKLVVTPTEHQLCRFHSTTGRCSPPPPFSQKCTSDIGIPCIY